MDRREAVKYISILLGGTMVGADAILSGCRSQTGKHREFTPEDIAYLNEIGETILPQTSTPGAKAANVGQFMTVMVNDTYEESDQVAFMEGLEKLNGASKKKFDKGFMEISPQQRHALLVEVDNEAKTYQKDKVNTFNDEEKKKEKDEIAKGNKTYKKQRMAQHYFTMMKGLTLFGYFTSEAGSKSFRYLPVPGRFDGCIDYKKGDKMIV